MQKKLPTVARNLETPASGQGARTNGQTGAASGQSGAAHRPAQQILRNDDYLRNIQARQDLKQKIERISRYNNGGPAREEIPQPPPLQNNSALPGSKQQH